MLAEARKRISIQDGHLTRANAYHQVVGVLPHLPIDALRTSLESYLLACQLVGALHQQRRMGLEVNGFEASRFSTGEWFVASDPNLNPFQQPFDKAIESLRERVFLSPERFAQLETAARSRAGRIAGIQNTRLVQRIYELLADIVEKGGTVHDFDVALSEMPELSGWGGVNDSHIELIFRQNATMAFQTGNYVSMQQAGVQKYRWRSYQDSCPICQPFIDKVFTLTDTAVFPGGAHFRCDCWAESIFEDDGDPGAAISAFPNDAYREAVQRPSALRFDPAQFGNTRHFDLSSVPNELRTAFEEYLSGIDRRGA